MIMDGWAAIHRRGRYPQSGRTRGVLGLLAVELRDMHSNTDWLDDVLPLRDPTELPRVLTRADAQRHGISPDAVDYRVRAGIWQRLAPAVYLAADRATDHDRAIAATAHGGPRAVLSGASRLRLLNMRAVRRVDHDLVLVPMSPGAHTGNGFGCGGPTACQTPTGRLASESHRSRVQSPTVRSI